MQEVLDNSNPQQLYLGNSDLNLEYGHRIFFKFNKTNNEKGSVFYSLFRLNITENHIGSELFTSGKTSSTVEGIELSPGTQLERPVNLNGYYNTSIFTTYGFPIKKIKSNLNLTLEMAYSEIPYIVNSRNFITQNPSAGFGVSLSSGISEKLDFTIGTESNINRSTSNEVRAVNNDFFRQDSKISLYWNFWRNMVLSGTFINNTYSGLDEQINPNYNLLNLNLAWKFLEDNSAELRISAFDVLNQNQSVSRIVEQTFVQDQEIQVLQQYFMLTFQYKIRAFKTDQ